VTAVPLPQAAFVVRDAAANDHHELLALHHAAFDSRWTPVEWRHRYGGNPLGRSRITAAFDADGRCHAAFGGVLLRCRIGESEVVACRGGDVAVAPHLRATAAGPRLLLRVCQAFVQGFVGTDVALIFGFPNQSLLRTLTHHCGHEVLGDVLWLAKPVATSLPSAGSRTTVSDRFPEDAACLLTLILAQRDVGLVRDRAYLRWRYEHNPLGRYVFVVARDTSGAPRGAVVVRCNGPHRDSVIVTEWLVPGDDADVTEALLAAVADVARELGRTDIVTCVAGSAPDFGRLQHRHGFRVVVSSYQMLFRSFTRAVTRNHLFERWRLSAGDLDFL
jgi:hypothetical protein